MTMPPTTDLGKTLREYRRTFWRRIADKLQSAGTQLDDPVVTAVGDYLYFADKVVHCPAAARLLERNGDRCASF